VGIESSLGHRWDVTPAEAREIQHTLRRQVITADSFGEIHLVAGVDVGFEDQGAVTRAAIVVLRFPELTVYESTVSHRPTTFPYIPGLLSFREAPAVLQALAQLSTPPDLLLCDGAGYAHPRRFGLACHIGVASGIPAIGVAKSRLIGEYEPVPHERGAWQPLHDHGEVIGAVLRTKVNVQPLFVSIGHRVSLASAIDYTLRCTRTYRLPETTRHAHNLASLKETGAR
jgi:deoxyribonuclease V